jgi:putative spermidine/putrescine transport system substrate-binding protein
MQPLDESVVSRRKFLRGAGAAAGAIGLPAVLAACSSSTSSGSSASASGGLSGSLVLADYGGTTHDARKSVFLDTFSKAKGVTVTSTVVAGALLTKMFDGTSGAYDLFQAGLSDLYKYQAHMASLPTGTAVNDQVPTVAQPYCVGTFVVGFAQGYLTSSFGGHGPTSWADFWDVGKFPGKRAIPGVPEDYDYVFEAALMADGVAASDLYPLDLTRAAAKLKELRPHLVFYTEYPQIQQLLISGTASIAFGPHGLYAALGGGKTATTVWNQAFISPNIFLIPESAKNKQNAYALADWLADGRRQAEFAKLTNYGPGNSSAFKYISADLLAKLPNSPANQKITIVADQKARAKQESQLLAAFTTWLSS